jgi:polysaccharide biosynthesis PFTS motif protein
MRGYRKLKEKNQLARISAVRKKLEDKEIEQKSFYPSKHIFGAGLDNAEIIIRQYLLARFRYVNFNEEILYYLGARRSSISYPMPKEWQDIMFEEGFVVNRRTCFFKWYASVYIYYCKGVITIFKNIILIIKNSISKTLEMPEKYTFFIGPTAGNLPQEKKHGKSYDLISWYEQWPGRVKNINAICHDVKGAPTSNVNGLPVVSSPASISYDLDFGKFIRYLIWGLIACLIALIDLLAGKWYHALILSEAAIATVVRLQNGNKLASEYMFGLSGVIYRPLWTYEAEKLGSKISLYFYSINSGGWKTKQGYPATAPGWRPMTWQYYLVWDKYQADFVCRETSESADVLIVGPIWFHDSKDEMEPCPPKTVAVFDVQPFRDSRYQLLGAPEEFYIPVIANRFLEDIYSAASNLNISIVFKRKREIGKLLHQKYKALLDDLYEAEDFISVPSEISALHVIEKCTAVISMPFSSPAVLAREQGKPSIYYDPFSSLQKDDRSAHGIEIISGVTNLEKWLFEIYGGINNQKNLSIGQ